MTVYVVLAYDEDGYTFETFMGVFRTEIEAKKCIDNDYWESGLDGVKYQEHEEYKIIKKEI